MKEEIEILEKLHNILYELLCEFDRICKKHNIHYFLDSGTALGAVRHRGFIPWDDDLDVGMMRDDYNKFLKVAYNEIHEKYILLTKDVDANYKKYHAKLVHKGSVYPEFGSENYKYRGIFIDIFPFDKISNDTYKRKRDFKRDLFYKRLISLKKSRPHSTKTFKLLLHYSLKFIPLSWIESKLNSLWNKYNATDSSYATCYLYKMLQKRNIVFPIASLLPIKQIQFEDRLFPIMHNYDDYLSIMYGDYMTLPPEDKREFHCCGEIIFNKNR